MDLVAHSFAILWILSRASYDPDVLAKLDQFVVTSNISLVVLISQVLIVQDILPLNHKLF